MEEVKQPVAERDESSFRRLSIAVSKINIALPAIDNKRKWVAGGFGYAAFCLIYTFTGTAPFRSVVALSPSVIDDFIPFINWTVWIYHAQFFFLFFCVMALKKTVNISRALYSMAAASLLAFLTFAVYPTSVPRIHSASAGLTKAAFDFLYRIDSSANSFPSLHVSLAWLAALSIVDEYGKRGLIALTVAFLITISTMTTKQHYFIDVIAGLALMWLCRLLASRISQKSQ
jgi:membrane-associated phospholipid phosphatase